MHGFSGQFCIRLALLQARHDPRHRRLGLRRSTQDPPLLLRPERVCSHRIAALPQRAHCELPVAPMRVDRRHCPPGAPHRSSTSLPGSVPRRGESHALYTRRSTDACLQYTPTYSFESDRAKFTLVLPDDYTIREAILSGIHHNARAWLKSAITRAPLEMQGLLQVRCCPQCFPSPATDAVPSSRTTSTEPLTSTVSLTCLPWQTTRWASLSPSTWSECSPPTRKKVRPRPPRLSSCSRLTIEPSQRHYLSGEDGSRTTRRTLRGRSARGASTAERLHRHVRPSSGHLPHV
jgi:hypothetical protein